MSEPNDDPLPGPAPARAGTLFREGFPFIRTFRRFQLPFGLGEFRVGRASFLLFLGALTGTLTGLLVAGYRTAVFTIGEDLGWFQDSTYLLWPDLSWNTLARLLWPALGAFVIGYILYKMMDSTGLHGVPGVIKAVRVNRVRFPLRMLLPSILSVGTLATGGSAGPEGPVAEIGSVIGAKIGRFAKVHRHTYRTLVASGVAAAISAVFNSPIGGVFFALEVILLEFELTSFSPVLLASVFGSLVCEYFTIGDPALQVPNDIIFKTSEIPFYALLGIFCGFASIGFIRSLSWTSVLFKKLNIPRWIKPALAGLGVGLIGVFVPQVMGEGYSVLNHQFNTGILLTTLCIIFIGKWIATCLTLGSGSPGGIFAPSLVIGGTAGSILGYLFKGLFPNFVGEPESYALMGVAGMITGVLNAPMTAIMIVLRKTEGNYQALLPLMTTVSLTLYVMSRWEHVSYYTYQLRQSGDWKDEKTTDPLIGLLVADILNRGVLRLPEKHTVQKALEAIKETFETIFIIEDKEGRYVGMVTLSDLRLAIPDPAMAHLVTLGDLADRHVMALTPETTLRQAVELIIQTEREGLPVFDPSDTEHCVGVITRSSVLEAYGASARS